MINPEDMNIIIALLEKDGENENLLNKLKLMHEITKVSEESRAKINELDQKLRELSK